MQVSKMKELTLDEIEQVNGGNPAVVIVGVLMARKYGAKAIGFAAGAFIAWMAE
ncbi:hypothetical protein [Shewanella halifaxensis]|uniref:hypothetical protein n=1 Tax=Shewanella halifaxensis TaxID=271098 RepID=UPI000311BD5F|nr:hypothetical protein [Shewanella halifaxensis]